MLKRHFTFLLTLGALYFSISMANAQEMKPEQGSPDPTTPEVATQAMALPVQPVSAAPKPLVSYEKGILLRTNDDTLNLKINLRTHILYTFVRYDGSPDESNFSIATTRLSLSGRAFLDPLTYRLEAEMGKGNFILYDAFTDYASVPKTLHLRVGMWKRPFSRQFMSSSARYETVEQSSTNAFFGAGYDTGIAFHNNYEKSPELEWVVGVFNGRNTNYPWVKIDPANITKDSTKTSDILTNYPSRFHPMVVARAGYNYGGIEGYSEADLDGGPLRLAVAANIAYDIDYDDDGASALNAGVDMVLKLQGLSVSGAYYLGYANANGGDMEQKGMGGFAQAGYMVAGRFEPVVRYSIVSPKEGRSYSELGAGLSVYFLKHNLKWQTFASGLTNAKVLKGTPAAGSDTTDYTIKTQLVTAF